ncbi:MAG: VOC family protein [Pseudomonadota bacterium]
MSRPTHNTVTQNAWIVNDIEKAARQWSATMGIGPFFLGHYTSDLFEGMRYRGADGALHMKTAIAFSGDLQIELIQPMGDEPSAYRDVYPVGGEGFHHMCFWSDDLDADLAYYEQAGCETVNVGRMRGGPRFAYVDTRKQMGCMIELLEPHEHVIALFAGWKQRADDWDGKDPIVFL